VQNDESFNGLRLLYLTKKRPGSLTSTSEITVDCGRPYSFSVYSPIFEVTTKKLEIEYGHFLRGYEADELTNRFDFYPCSS